MLSPTYSAGHHEPPGLVVKVLKKEGDRVQAGELVLILEAMKMQNELRASQSGVVKQINT
jgi:biotin carboxyl carrier protein